MASAIQKRMIHLFLFRRSVTRCSEGDLTERRPSETSLRGSTLEEPLAKPSKPLANSMPNHSQRTRKVLAKYSQITRKPLANANVSRKNHSQETTRKSHKNHSQIISKPLANYSQILCIFYKTTRKVNDPLLSCRNPTTRTLDVARQTSDVARQTSDVARQT